MKHKVVHYLFLISVLWKGLVGILEAFSSAILFSSGTLSTILILLTRHELGEDPADFIANRVREFLPYLSAGTQFFAATYFLIHGVVNIMLSIGLLRGKLRAFHAAIFVHFLFIVYQLYRFTHTHSLTLIFLSIFDIFVIWFIWRESWFLQEHHNNKDV